MLILTDNHGNLVIQYLVKYQVADDEMTNVFKF